MKTQSIDTHPKMEELLITMIRKLSIAQKISKVSSLSQTIMFLSKRAITRANPYLTQNEIKTKYVYYHYGDNMAKLYSTYLKSKQTNQLNEILSAAEPVAKAFEKFGKQ